MKILNTFFLMFFTLSLSLLAQDIPKIPTKTNDFVNDYANVLSVDEERMLRELAYSIEEESSSQVVVVTTNDIDKDYPIEQFSIDLAQNWGIGQKGVDNGVLILICPDNHKARIEVGYGLEGILTDAYTRRIQEQHFKPNFRQNNFYKGISEVMYKIKDQISPEAQEQRRQLAMQREKEAQEAAEAFGNFMLWFLIIAIASGLIGFAIYKTIEEQRRKERERREKEEAERREKERIIRNAENEERILYETFDKTINTFKRMGDFFNAKEILIKLIELRHSAKAALKDALYFDYQTICRPMITQIRHLSDNLLKNFEIKEKVENNARQFKQNIENLKNSISTAINTVTRINNNYSDKVWGSHKDTVNTFIYRYQNNLDVEIALLNYHNLAMICLTEAQQGNFNKFIEAEENTKKATSNYEYYLNLCRIISDVDKKIKDAITSLASFNATIKTKINEVSEYHRKHRSDITTRTKHDWEDFLRKPIFHVNMKSDNPLFALEEAKKYFNEIEEFLNKAKKDVKTAQKKRDDEEEEERRRRRRQAASSYSSSYSSGSSFGGSGGGGSSFGGGSFGGGGSSSNW